MKIRNSEHPIGAEIDHYTSGVPGSYHRVVFRKLGENTWQAVKQIFRTGTWFPMPKDIRDAAMLAPSSVLPPLPLNQTVIPEFTEQQRKDAANKLDGILNGFGEWGNA